MGKPPSEALINSGLAAGFAVMRGCLCVFSLVRLCVRDGKGSRRLLHCVHMGTAGI